MADSDDELQWPPGASFQPLLNASLNAYAVCDTRGRYVYTCGSMSNICGFHKLDMQGCACRGWLRGALRSLSGCI